MDELGVLGMGGGERRRAVSRTIGRDSSCLLSRVAAWLLKQGKFDG